MKVKNYQGYKYTSEIIEDEDTCKLLHFAEKAGIKTEFDWTPYKTPDQASFERWIDLGMPGRVGNAPLDSNDLIKMMQWTLG
jgi:hypothetical protein